jgi:hypothetical protein
MFAVGLGKLAGQLVIGIECLKAGDAVVQASANILSFQFTNTDIGFGIST